MLCWICGKEGNSGEHLIKASDLKSVFPEISQKKPIYFHSGEKKNIPMGSINNPRMKSKALICNDCNSSLSQPYDKAWEIMSHYLRSNWTILIQQNKINVSKVFPGKSRISLLYIHLYFVKLFGCKIIEDNVPIKIESFSQALLNRTFHKDIFISLGNRPSKERKMVGVSPITALNYYENTAFATWLYIVDTIGVKIIYNTLPANERELEGTWHPSTPNKIIKLRDF